MFRGVMVVLTCALVLAAAVLSPHGVQDADAAFAHDAPDEVELNVRLLSVVRLDADADRIDPLVAPGLRICYSPCVRLGGGMSEEPDLGLGVLNFWTFAYSDARIDGQPVEDGVLALVTLAVEPDTVAPPVDVDFDYQALMVAAPEPLASAFRAAGVPVPRAEVTWVTQQTTPAWASATLVDGEGYDMAWTTEALGQPLNQVYRDYVIYAGTADNLSGAFVWSERDGHHTPFTPSVLSGTVGPFGDVHTATVGELAFYGTIDTAGEPSGAWHTFAYHAYE